MEGLKHLPDHFLAEQGKSNRIGKNGCFQYVEIDGGYFQPGLQFPASYLGPFDFRIQGTELVPASFHLLVLIQSQVSSPFFQIEGQSVLKDVQRFHVVAIQFMQPPEQPGSITRRMDLQPLENMVLQAGVPGRGKF